MRSFEQQVVEEFQRSGYSCGLSPKAVWIRGHLLSVGQDYGSAMFKQYEVFIMEARAQGAKIRTAKESSFFAYLSELRQLGLIQSIPYTWEPRKRRYYRINPQRTREEFWHNPRLRLYRKSWRKAPKKPKPLGRRPSAESHLT